MGKTAALTLAAGASAALGSSLGCVDGSGHATDFWYSFKYPGGWNYAYMTSGKDLKQASDTMDADSSAVSRTLGQLYSDHSSLTYAMWNDEPYKASKVGGPKAHAKGVLAFDGKQGFWLTHSLPEFPANAAHGSADYANPSDKYGQSYLCITIDKSAFSALAPLFSIDELVIYDAADNAKVGEDFTSWAMDKPSSDKQTGQATVTSVGGQDFTVFAKSGKWDDALYDNLVAKSFRMNFVTETWQNGVGKMKSNCDGSYKVYNAKDVSFPGAKWTETKDHSKWAVSKTGAVFCVGDINRQNGQAHRGGGTVCIKSEEFAKQMQGVIVDFEDCGGELAANATLIV
eukprot:TRINITY_DN5297_c0_g1_i1.p2 TRINITY_DN5297_c0_g1~~TRINITY_DN5297_c0_g1_i1.p2  ORF type:complete len:343 (+),score=103.84 TRINITY_DN5297_c0_g1_i1:114-1142(+)